MHKKRDLPASLDLLRGFEAAARHLSFTEAAAELFVTQSAISRQVQTLEEQLGVKLFERRTRALVLTGRGEAYYHDVAQTLQQLREATARVRADPEPVVRVTTTVTFASLWLVPRLADFQSRHGDIAVHVAADNAIRDLGRASLDLAVRYSTAEAAGGDAVMLFGEQVVPVCSPGLARKIARLEKAEDLLRCPLLHYDDPEARTPWLSWKVWMEAMGMTAPRRAQGLSFSHYDQAIQAAMAGQGIALGRFPLVQALIDQKRLVMPLRGKRYATIAKNRAYWLIVSPAAAARGEVCTFVTWLRSEVARAKDLEKPIAP